MARLLHSLLLLAVAAAPLRATAASPGTRADDLAHRDKAIHWPREFDPAAAPVFSHNELLIPVDCHRVWTQLINVTAWPDWFVLTRDVTLDDPRQPLQHGTRMHLKIFGSPITARIDEFVEFIPDSRLSWFPQGLDETRPAHYHTWRLVPEPAGCHVVTEEAGIGPNDIKAPASASKLMHQAHDLWLASLRWRSDQ